MSLVDILILMIFPSAMVFALASDMFTMTISNRVSLGLIAGFGLMALLMGMPPGMMLDHASAGFAVLMVGFLLFWAGWIGGGDAKLAAATALWLGFPHLLDYVVMFSLYGGLLTIIIVLARAYPLPGMLTGQEWALRLHQPRGDIPYAIALGLAGLQIYPNTLWMSGF
ncbi:MAG: prepilin peptidase [Pseudomonadota bacterium]